MDLGYIYYIEFIKITKYFRSNPLKPRFNPSKPNKPSYNLDNLCSYHNNLVLILSKLSPSYSYHPTTFD